MEGKNYINGEWVGSASGKRFEKRSPADTSDVVGTFPSSTAQDVAAAVEAAHRAYPSWRQKSLIERSEYLDRFVQIAKAEKEEISRLMAREMGKAINECRADVTEGIHMAQYMVGRARMAYGEVLSSEFGDKESFMLRRPKGVVAAITPWNFPFAIPLWLIAPSLLTGNTVVLKPARDTPATAQKIAEVLGKAELPAGVFNLVQGSGEEAGWPLVNHPQVPVVVFVGSYDVGSRIKQAVAADFRKMSACEMGGKNAIIVFDDAEIDLAVNASLISAFKTSGQRCSAASRLIVQEGILDSFLDRLIAKARRLAIGNPLREDVFTGPVVNQQAVDKILYYNNLSREEGARVLLEGGRLHGDGYDRGYYLSPHIYLMPHRSSARVLREEVFGPHLAVIPFKTMEEAFYIHNDVDYGLTFSVITEDYRKARLAREECEFGVGYWNLATIGAEVHLPFGGLKKSGTGMPSAATLIDVLTHRYAWTVNYGKEIKLAQGLKAEVP